MSILSRIIDVPRPGIMLGTIGAGSVVGGLVGTIIKDKKDDANIAFSDNAILGAITSIAASAFSSLLIERPKATIVATLGFSAVNFLTYIATDLFENITPAQKKSLKKIAIVVASVFSFNFLSTWLFQRPIS